MDCNTLIGYLNANYARGIYFEPEKYTPSPPILRIPEPDNGERGVSVYLTGLGGKLRKGSTCEIIKAMGYDGRFEGGKEVTITFLLIS